MSATSGIGLAQLAKDSLLRSKRDFYFAPLAANDALIVASVDPNGVAVGGTFTLATPANGLLLRRARQVTMTINDDDAGGGLSLTVRLTGHRQGVFQQEILTATSTDTNDTTVTSVKYYDEVTELKLLAKTADAGDDVTFGIADSSFGLDFPISNVADVQLIMNISTATEQAAVAISSTTVDVAQSAVKALGTLATTDRWEIRYLSSLDKDGSGPEGVWR